MKKSSITIFSISVLAILILVSTAAHAVKEFKISSFGGAVQIWFEAEHFDERSPAGSRYFQVTGEPGVAAKAPKEAFGEAITRAGGAGGMIRWTFNISPTEGEGGTWYFWARVINPSNQSDYMLVKDDQGDKKIPEGPPFPGGDAVPPFDNADDRLFEDNVGPPWNWWGKTEGATKELQDGENTMYIFHRQGNNTVFWDVFMWTDSAVYLPNDEDYINAKPGRIKPEAVLPVEKLSTTWGGIRNRMRPD